MVRVGTVLRCAMEAMCSDISVEASKHKARRPLLHDMLQPDRGLIGNVGKWWDGGVRCLVNGWQAEIQGAVGSGLLAKIESKTFKTLCQ